MTSRSSSRSGLYTLLAFLAAALLILVPAAVIADATPTDLGPVTYDYNAGLYDAESGNYPGVYTATLTPNIATAETAPTIGMPSIADGNLDEPTTESPAIIQGAAVGYEEKTGPVDYTKLKDRVEPYSDYTYTIMEEQAQDGTTHKKLSGFDQTYVIVRLDVSEFFEENNFTKHLHMLQEGNSALIPGSGMADNDKAFITMTGEKSGAYLVSDLIDKTGATSSSPYVDVLVFATAANVAGADTGKADMPNGDIPIQFYLDDVADYNPDLTYDPASTDPDHAKNVLAKFFDASKVDASAISRFLIKGSDLALEVSVENSSGPDKNEDTTYWSLKKALEDPYYDLPEDASAADPGTGREVKLISEVAVTEPMTLRGEDADHLKKRTLNVNSFDIQVANNTAEDQSTYTSGFTLENAWLKLEDRSNTTGAELAIGNNARFTIDDGGKLIIDESCQLEVEWDGASTAPGTEPAQPDVLNNGQLDLRAGGEIVNNGIISIEGYEGKPVPDGSAPDESPKGCGELTIAEGAVLTNNGTIVANGKLTVLGTLNNNGKYDDLIVSNDPDKGRIAFHKGIQVGWKDDVTQSGIQPGTLIVGQDADGNVLAAAMLNNNGDILLVPGNLDNYATLTNTGAGRVLLATADEAIIPINPDPATPTITTKRVTLNPPTTSVFNNYGTLVNNGQVLPAYVALNDDTSLGAMTIPGPYPEMFTFNNEGTVIMGESIVAIIQTADGVRIVFCADSSFTADAPDGAHAGGTYAVADGRLVFTLSDGTVVEPVQGENGDAGYTLGSMKFVLSGEFIARVTDGYKAWKSQVIPVIYNP